MRESANIEQLQERAERNAPPSDGLDSFVRISRVRELIGSKSNRTVQRWVAAGLLPRPCIKNGNVVLWSLAELRQWQQNKLAQREKAA